PAMATLSISLAGIRLTARLRTADASSRPLHSGGGSPRRSPPIHRIFSSINSASGVMSPARIASYAARSRTTSSMVAGTSSPIYTRRGCWNVTFWPGEQFGGWNAEGSSLDARPSGSWNSDRIELGLAGSLRRWQFGRRAPGHGRFCNSALPYLDRGTPTAPAAAAQCSQHHDLSIDARPSGPPSCSCHRPESWKAPATRAVRRLRRWSGISDRPDHLLSGRLGYGLVVC